MIEFIERIKKNPNPTSIQDTRRFQKYVEPYVWRGTLKVNGGWGYKNEISAMIPKATMRLPFGLEAVLTEEKDEELLQGLREEGWEGEAPNPHYSVSFPGEQFKLLGLVIEYIQDLGAEKQEYCFLSYDKEVSPKEGEPVYKLLVTATQEDIIFRIEQCHWVINPDETETLGGWSQKRKE